MTTRTDKEQTMTTTPWPTPDAVMMRADQVQPNTIVVVAPFHYANPNTRGDYEAVVTEVVPLGDGRIRLLLAAGGTWRDTFGLVDHTNRADVTRAEQQTLYRDERVPVMRGGQPVTS